MNNIVIPVINVDQIPFVEEVKKNKDCKIIVGVREELASKIKKSRSKNFSLKIFDNSSKKEEIINSLSSELDEGKVLICRKPLSKDEITAFFDSKSDITVCKENRSKFKNFFFRLWQTFMSFLFGFEFFDGDISAICFSEKIFNVLSNIENLSYASRVNKWKGVDVGSIETSTPPAKKEYSRVKANFMLYGWIFFYLAAIASAFVYFYFVKATFLTALLYACGLLLVQIGLLIGIAIFNLNLRVGQRVFNKAKVKS